MNKKIEKFHSVCVCKIFYFFIWKFFTVGGHEIKTIYENWQMLYSLKIIKFHVIQITFLIFLNSCHSTVKTHFYWTKIRRKIARTFSIFFFDFTYFFTLHRLQEKREKIPTLPPHHQLQQHRHENRHWRQRMSIEIISKREREREERK